MKCIEFPTRLNELLDRRVDPEGDLALAAHAAECLACRRMLDGAVLMLTALQSAPRRPVDAAVYQADAVAEPMNVSSSPCAVHPVRRAGLHLGGRRSIMALGLAASLLMLVRPYLAVQPPIARLAPSHRDEPAGNVPRAMGVHDAPAPAAVPPGGVAVVAAPETSPLPFLPAEIFSAHSLPLLRDRGEDLAGLVIRQIPVVGLASLAGSSDRLTAKSRQWVHSAADNLRPLAAPVTDAIENLRWVMPHLRGGQPS